MEMQQRNLTRQIFRGQRELRDHRIGKIIHLTCTTCLGNFMPKSN